LRQQERTLLQGSVQARVRRLLPQQERQPWRCEGRVLYGTLVQRREQAPLRLNERGLVRGPSMGPKRWPLQ
jgi:hypothetical protein